MPRTCRICGREGLARGLDLGPQPVSNRFKKDLAEPDFRQELEIFQCGFCGLVQLAESFPVEEVRPRLAWIQYREREDHLEEAVAAFFPLMRMGTLETVFGITHFDEVLARALRKQKMMRYVPFSVRGDLEIAAPTFGMETFQQALTPDRARRFVENEGKGQVIISRYLFEHAEKPLKMLEVYRELLTEDGFLILEIPDARGPLERCDYQMIWEEHVTYFTEHSLRWALANNGFSICAVFRAESKFEQPLLVLAQKRSGEEKASEVSPGELSRFGNFRDSFTARKEALQEFCRRQLEGGRTLALFGAGHFTVALVSFFELEKYVAFVVDGDPNKRGNFLAGTSLPIVSAERLQQEENVAVLLCVNPDGEERLMETLKLKGFIREGEGWYSIFAASPRFCLHA